MKKPKPKSQTVNMNTQDKAKQLYLQIMAKYPLIGDDKHKSLRYKMKKKLLNTVDKQDLMPVKTHLDRMFKSHLRNGTKEWWKQNSTLFPK